MFRKLRAISRAVTIDRIYFLRPRAPLSKKFGAISLKIFRRVPMGHLFLLNSPSRHRPDSSGANRCAPCALNGFRRSCRILHPPTVGAKHSRYWIDHIRSTQWGDAAILHDIGDFWPVAELITHYPNSAGFPRGILPPCRVRRTKFAFQINGAHMAILSHLI